MAVDAPTVDQIVTTQMGSNDDVIIREQPVSTAMVHDREAMESWDKGLCQCGGKGSCRTCCCPLLSLADFAEKSESNILGKTNRGENVRCAGLFAYFCCCPELLCFLTLLLREEYKGKTLKHMTRIPRQTLC